MADIDVDFDKVGLLAVRDGRILLCRKKHTTDLQGDLKYRRFPEDQKINFMASWTTR